MMNCPKCQAAMQQVTFDDIEVDRCSDCSGIWLDMREHQHLKNAAGSEAIDIGDTAIGQSQNELGDIDCPHCKTKMIKMVDVHQPHIWYEMCATCGGVYFDAGEFTDFKFETFADTYRRWATKPRM